MDIPADLIFDLVKAEELSDAIVIEQEGFPPDEAASLDKFRFRQEQAPDLFLGAFVPSGGGGRRIIGYICSTLSSSESLTHESMSVHVPNASTICIHAICTQKSFRRKGVGTRLLNEYVSRLRTRAQSGSAPYERIVLISHDNLISFYENAGFKNLGKSSVVHGSLPWYELRVDLNSAKSAASTIPTSSTMTISPTQVGDQQVPTGLWETLLRGSATSDRPRGKLLSSFKNGISDVIIASTEGVSMNKYDLLCPRPGCGSVILKRDVGMWVERASEQLQPSDVPLSPLLPPLPPVGETAQWWLVTPSPMVFENIGFSKPVGLAGSKKKLLACAECDLGPLGWSEEGGTEFWLSCCRVAYLN